MHGVRDLAKATGFSTATVSRALRHDPSVREKTREVVLAKARALGYKVNPYFGDLMSAVRHRTRQSLHGNLAMLWYEKLPEPGRDRELIILQHAAKLRAEESGYVLNEFALSDYKPALLKRVLRSRGIQGILITPPSFSPRKNHLRFELNEFAAVSLGWGLMQPQLHTIRFDYYQAMRMALHHARRISRRNVAAIWSFATDRRADHVLRAAFLAHHPRGATVGETLFLELDRHSPAEMTEIMREHHISALIAGTEATIPPEVRAIIPAENTIIFDDPKGRPYFGWIDMQRPLLARWGIDQLVGQLHQREFGVPRFCRTTLVPPVGWFRHSRNVTDTF